MTKGNQSDLNGADILLPNLKAKQLLADKAYASEKRVVKLLRDKGINVVTPSKKNNPSPRPIDKDLYKARHLIENFFAKLKQYRALATRYDKLAKNFLSGVYLVGLMTWLN